MPTKKLNQYSESSVGTKRKCVRRFLDKPIDEIIDIASLYYRQPLSKSELELQMSYSNSRFITILNMANVYLRILISEPTYLIRYGVKKDKIDRDRAYLMLILTNSIRSKYETFKSEFIKLIKWDGCLIC